MKYKLTLMLLLLVPLASALDLEDYPSFFYEDGEFNAIIVVGEDAPVMDVTSAIQIIPGLQKHSEDRIRGSTLDDDVDDLDQNILSIGNSCDNDVTWEIMGKEPCLGQFDSGGYIFLYESGDYAWLLVGGETMQDTAKAAYVLGSYEEYNLDGNAIKVTGDYPYTVENVLLPGESIALEVTESDDEPEPELYDEADEAAEDLKDIADQVEQSDEWDYDFENPADKIKQELDDELEELENGKEEIEEEEPEEEAPEGFFAKSWFKFKKWITWFFR
ncbi:hypothetical protein ACFL1B_04950 [Nanoarchaeota archaeon]